LSIGPGEAEEELVRTVEDAKICDNSLCREDAR